MEEPSNKPKRNPSTNPFDDDDSPPPSAPPFSDPNATQNSDDDFVHLDELPGSGITNARGEPKVRILEEDGFVIIPNHLRQPSEEQTNEMVRLPATHPKPINKLSIEELSICIYLFGGSDFNYVQPEQKTYSLWNIKRESMECMRDGSEGGPYRDHTVCVQAKISKIALVRQLFASNSPILSLSMLTIADVEVLDHLLISNINKFFYQYVDPSMPRRLYAPLLSVRIVEDQNRDGKLKISLLPLRLNIDQDTLEFLTDFLNIVAICGASLPEDPHDEPPINDYPVMEVAEHRPSSYSAPIQSPSPNKRIPEHQSTNPFDEPVVTWSKGTVAEDSDEEETGEISVLRSDNHFDPFDESDINFGEADFGDIDAALNEPILPLRSEPSRHSKSSIQSHGTNNSSSPTKMRRPSAQSNTRLEDQLNFASNASANIHPSCSTPSVADSNCTSATSTIHKRLAVKTNVTFFKEFTFEPACVIRFDYIGKRVKTDQGALIGFLKGMMETKCTQLMLKELHNELGILGWNKCVDYAISEWWNDLLAQMPSTITSYAPIASLVQIGQGIRDLFYIPMSEMRREDGRLIRGFQRGAISFGTSTATATIDAAQQLAFFVQGIAEFAFDLVTPDLPYRDYRRHNAIQHQNVRVPKDIREGVYMAYDTFSTGFRETARSLHNAAQEDRARLANEPSAYSSGWSGSKGILRQVIPTVIRPVVVGSQASIQVLSGLKNQLKPEEHQEELEKWRQSTPSSSQRHPRYRQGPSKK